MNHHDDPKRALHKAIWLPCLLLSMLCFSPGVIQGVLIFLGLSLINLSGACLFNDNIISLWKALNESEAGLSFNKWFQSTFDRSAFILSMALLLIIRFIVKFLLSIC